MSAYSALIQWLFFVSILMCKENHTEEKENKKMALTRAMLKGMDIDKENIDKIIEAHTETVDALKEERDNLKTEADKVKGLKGDIESLKESMVEKSEYDSLKSKYDKLKGDFEEYKSDINAKDIKASKAEAYKSLLKEAGIAEKRIASVSKVADLSKIELDEEGKIKGADDLIKSIKEEWSDFIETSGKKGADTPKPPANNGGKTMTKEDILAIKDTADRQKAMAENPELFGIE